METLRWQIGDATVFRIGELDAAATLEGLISEFDLADISHDAWLTPNFVDEQGRLRALVQAFLTVIADQKIIIDPGVGNGKKRVAVPGWESDTLIIGSHFADPVAGHIRRQGTAFCLAPAAG
jgi:hypothetical protein